MRDEKRIKSYPSASMAVIIGAIIGTILYLLVSCQPKGESQGSNCEKTVIYKALFDQYHKKKPLNK